MKYFVFLTSCILTVGIIFYFVGISKISNIFNVITDIDNSLDTIEIQGAVSTSFDADKALAHLQSNLSTDKSDLSNEYFRVRSMLTTTYADVVGWIRIAELGISYPIMYNSEDNMWYLKHAWNGDESRWGCISMDIQTKGQWTVHTLLNGHNMKDPTMFGRLPELMDKSVFDTVDSIEIYDGKDYRLYKIFSVFSVNDKEETLPIYEETFIDYKSKIQEYQNRSMYYRSIPNNATEALILNTCWYGESGYERNLHCIVAAYRII